MSWKCFILKIPRASQNSSPALNQGPRRGALHRFLHPHHAFCHLLGAGSRCRPGRSPFTAVLWKIIFHRCDDITVEYN